MTDIEDAMPIGNCVVCGEYLDHSDAGFCDTCGQGFHWHRCGGWNEGEHECINCNKSDSVHIPGLTDKGRADPELAGAFKVMIDQYGSDRDELESLMSIPVDKLSKDQIKRISYLQYKLKEE